MPSHLSCLLVCALYALAPAAHAQEGGIAGGVVAQPRVQPSRDTVQRTAHSLIRGRVLSSDGGAPLRRATVRVSGPGIVGNRLVATDSNGRYEFRELAPGRYLISASKTAYVDWSYGQTRFNGVGKSIVLQDNQVADNIDVRLARGAVITGRVVDEFGEPVAYANVQSMRPVFSQGQRRTNLVGNTQTNDIGEYRLFGLTPGQYYLSAAPQPMPFRGTDGVDFSGGSSNGFAPTFYPATPDLGAAQKLAVGVAQTLSGIDIALTPARLATVRGVVDSQGRQLTNTGVQITRRGGSNLGLPGSFGSITPDGTFAVPNVPPGEYILRATMPRLPQTPGTAPGAPAEIFVALVTVNGEDVTGVRLVPVGPVTLAGQILFDDSAATQSMKASMLRVVAVPINPENSVAGFFGGPPDLTVRDDFTFELKAFPGRIGLRVFAPRAQIAPNGNGWQIKSVRVNGEDVTDAGIDLGSQGLTGVEIEMTARAPLFSGRVIDSKGDAVKDYAVVVFAQDRARWMSPMDRYSAMSRASDDGTFKFTTLPPGEYLAVALDGVDPSAWQDPDTLENLSRVATPFVLTSGESRTLDLRMSTPP